MKTRHTGATIAAVAGSLALTGCVSSLKVAGYTGGYGEVFLGRGSNSATSTNWMAVLEPSKVTCTATGTMIGVASWKNHLTCSDGRTATIDTQMVDGAMSRGTGQFSNGTSVTIVRTIDARADDHYRRFKEEQGRQLNAGQAIRPAPAVAPKPYTPQSPPLAVSFPRGPERPDDVAVIVGNADYTRLGRDIPDIKPAHADAEGARLYATQALGIREGNVILLKDATGSQLTRVFGSKDNPQGQLFDWVKPGKSRVYVYYSGHGAPSTQGGSPYLVPTDADAARIELNGYPLKQLYDNLGKLPTESVTVVLEACFSGVSPAGSVLGKASPVFFDVKAPPVPGNVTVIAAGAANQMASWETDESSGLFTKYYLKAMTGEADADKDGRVSLDELDRYLKETLTYFARRHYGRDQQAQIVKGGGS